MKKIFIILLTMLFLYSCSLLKHMTKGGYGSPNIKQELLDESTFKITKYSQDKTYGYTTKNPVMVGGSSASEGPLNERRFLNALSGPNGEILEYSRVGSCCHFNTKNGAYGGMLDIYNVSYSGLENGITIYINMYDSDTLRVPVGLKLK